MRQSVGIDCSKDHLDCSFGIMHASFDEVILSNSKFTNNAAGLKKLLLWSKKLMNTDCEVVFLMEATGVYHERAALFLFESKNKVAVLLPNKVKAFAGTLKVKTVNDKECAKIIALFGLEKNVDPWSPPQEVFNQIRQLTRERDQLLLERTMKKNQLHAEKVAWPNSGSIKRIEQQLKIMNKQIKEIETEIKDLINANPCLKEKMKKLCSIKGVGMITAAIVVAETNGFNLIRNKSQLVSYAGLDVIEKQSGTSVRGKTRISKRGNKYLRKCLYFPAFTSINHYEPSKNLYTRIISKTGLKMKGAVAVQRKILVLIYVLWKKDPVL
ncbi:MAG: IS110 family transposase [Bacteroidetes bacterium]|nr:IS110 family transposase [Bacteroidota bacterium]